jgi:ArsR family transcriptional regulator
MLDSMRRFKAGVFQALAHPTRIAIIEQLCVGEMSVGRLCKKIGIEQANASQHLAVLRNKHLVETRKQGNQILYRLRDPAIATVLGVLRKFFLSHLSEALALLREEEQQDARPSKPNKRVHPRATPGKSGVHAATTRTIGTASRPNRLLKTSHKW